MTGALLHEYPCLARIEHPGSEVTAWLDPRRTRRSPLDRGLHLAAWMMSPQNSACWSWLSSSTGQSESVSWSGAVRIPGTASLRPRSFQLPARTTGRRSGVTGVNVPCGRRVTCLGFLLLTSSRVQLVYVHGRVRENELPPC